MSTINNVLITGASSGFGKLIAVKLLEQGTTVIATMRDAAGRNAGAAEELKAAAEGAPGALHVLEMDVSDVGSVDSAVKQATETAGPIDVVINNAGIGCGGQAEAFTAEEFSQILDVNVLGVHRVNRAVLQGMRERGEGLIINVSSILGRVAMPFAAPYNSSKWALEGLIETLRIELTGTGVDVAIVEPGGFMTGFMGNMFEPGDKDRVASYGEAADAPEKMWSGFVEAMTAEGAPDPQDVADAIANLIDKPAGERPFRTIVDPLMGGAGAAGLNELQEQVQVGIAQNMG
ncbi:hypothetical protein BVX97_03800 [bacterium E08(2017)]|nr:hypothetical protein BVX97_03800 [bacterium E08(2017)]